MITVFNPAPHPPQVSAQEWIEQFPTDVLVLNFSEAVEMLEMFGAPGKYDLSGSCKDLCKELMRSIGASAVILTTGAQGSNALVAKEDGVVEFYHSASFRNAAPLMDTTGAGDTFLGYFMTALMGSPNEIEAALDAGNAAASISVCRPGTLISIPSKRDVIEYMASQNYTRV